MGDVDSQLLTAGLYEPLYAFLKLNGTGSEQITGAHSAETPGRYRYSPPSMLAGSVALIQRIRAKLRWLKQTLEEDSYFFARDDLKNWAQKHGYPSLLLDGQETDSDTEQPPDPDAEASPKCKKDHLRALVVANVLHELRDQFPDLKRMNLEKGHKAFNKDTGVKEAIFKRCQKKEKHLFQSRGTFDKFWQSVLRKQICQLPDARKSE